MNIFPGYVICDLDGCLSDDRWRQDKLPAKDRAVKLQADYDAYHAACYNDDVVASTLSDVKYALYDAHSNQRALLLIVTARPDRGPLFAKTLAWVCKALHDDTVFQLLMRPHNSLDASPMCKMRLLNVYFRGVHTHAAIGWQRVVAAFDDRPDVLDVYPIEEGEKHLIHLDAPHA